MTAHIARTGQLNFHEYALFAKYALTALKHWHSCVLRLFESVEQVSPSAGERRTIVLAR
jgi:hypothetical protein